MKNELKELIQSDLYRYYDKVPFIKPIQVKYLIAFRKASVYEKWSVPGIINRLRLKRLSEKTMIQIPTATIIGKGFYIGHFGRIIINPNVKIGENVNVATGVTIGRTNRGKKMGVPTIGNQVWIGTNAVIVGNITIEDDVLVAPNSFVNIDVPAHSVVMGNPAQIYAKEYATEGYINRMV